MKRRKHKQLAREFIRYSLRKYGVSQIKDIWDDFHYESCVCFLMDLGFKYDYKTGKKIRIKCL